MIHREVFPKNVLVSYHAQVKLADFRSARVRSVAPAKLVYRSPEQTRRIGRRLGGALQAGDVIGEYRFLARYSRNGGQTSDVCKIQAVYRGE